MLGHSQYLLKVRKIWCSWFIIEKEICLEAQNQFSLLSFKLSVVSPPSTLTTAEHPGSNNIYLLMYSEMQISSVV